MATITLTIPDDKAALVSDTMDTNFKGRVTQDENGENVENYTKAQWAKLQIIKFIKRQVASYRHNQLTASAQNDANTEADEIGMS